jgi:hypothetical protein
MAVQGCLYPEEMELIRTKEDAILENAEIIPILEQNMKEDTPATLNLLWPKIQAAATATK